MDIANRRKPKKTIKRDQKKTTKRNQKNDRRKLKKIIERESGYGEEKCVGVL